MAKRLSAERREDVIARLVKRIGETLKRVERIQRIIGKPVDRAAIAKGGGDAE